MEKARGVLNLKKGPRDATGKNKVAASETDYSTVPHRVAPHLITITSLRTNPHLDLGFTGFTHS